MRMSVDMLVSYLNYLGFSESNYSIGTEKDNRTCLIYEEGSWKVFFSEHGSRWDELEFNFEKVACTFFLGLFAQRHVEQAKERPDRA